MCIPGSGISLLSKATGIKPLGLMSPALAILTHKGDKPHHYGDGDPNNSGAMSYAGRG